MIRPTPLNIAIIGDIDHRFIYILNLPIVCNEIPEEICFDGLASTEYHAIVFDFDLLNSWEIYSKIKNIYPNIPVVGVNISKDKKRDAHNAGLRFRTVLKPINYQLINLCLLQIFVPNINERIDREGQIKSATRIADNFQTFKMEVGTIALKKVNQLEKNEAGLGQVSFSITSEIATSNANVLIVGFNCEALAEQIHCMSGRINNRLVSVNCYAIPSPVVHQEIERAIKQTRGGTLFINGIDTIPKELQLRLAELFSSSKSPFRLITGIHGYPALGVEQGQISEQFLDSINLITVFGPRP